MVTLTQKQTNRIAAVLALFYLVGVLGFSLAATAPFFHSLTGYTILGSFLVLLVTHREHTLRFWVLATLVFLGGFFIEMIGVNTGHVFGEYIYGIHLGPKLGHTPLLIGVNWLMLIYMVWALIQDWAQPFLVKTTIGAVLMTGYDLFLEPIAMETNMWTWPNQVVPVQNYLAWLLVSWLFLALFNWGKISFKNPLAVPLFIIQLLFFVVLNVIHHVG